MDKPNYITPEGFQALKDEKHTLWSVERPKVVKVVAWAASNGDRSENADYHAAKEKLRFIDRRLFYLNSMIEKSQIINPSLHSHSKISFGSTITLCNVDTDEEEIYTLCGVLESEPENGLISVHSPLAKAMIGKELDDMFSIQLPKGKKEYEIVNIEYKNIFSLKKNIRSEVDFSFH